jgi:hypothetical protein
MTDLPSVLGLYPYESVTHHLKTGRVVFEELVELVSVIRIRVIYLGIRDLQIRTHDNGILQIFFARFPSVC